MPGNRPKLAAITTVYRKMAHTQHIVDRFLEGYGWNGAHHHPEMDLIALYVDQVGADDGALLGVVQVAAQRVQRFALVELPGDLPAVDRVGQVAISYVESRAAGRMMLSVTSPRTRERSWALWC